MWAAAIKNNTLFHSRGGCAEVLDTHHLRSQTKNVSSCATAFRSCRNPVRPERQPVELVAAMQESSTSCCYTGFPKTKVSDRGLAHE
eukprot:9500549-Pyramimonas_sp.AAC.1